jgi:excisionase family DNA binding protein
MNDIETHMTLEEVADYLRTTTTVIKRLCREKKLPSFKVGKFWRFDRVELETWIRNQK